MVKNWVVRTKNILSVLFFILVYNDSYSQKKYNFRNKKYFSQEIIKNIDIQYIYELQGCYYSDSNFNKLGDHYFMGAYYIQFYDNGCYREMDYLEPNPAKTKMSTIGIFYLRKQKIYVDKLGVSSDRSKMIYTYKVKTKGDYIYLLDEPKSLFKPSGYICKVYKKYYKIPEEWKQYKADW